MYINKYTRTRISPISHCCRGDTSLHTRFYMGQTSDGRWACPDTVRYIARDRPDRPGKTGCPPSRARGSNPREVHGNLDAAENMADNGRVDRGTCHIHLKN